MADWCQTVAFFFHLQIVTGDTLLFVRLSSVRLIPLRYLSWVNQVTFPVMHP